MLAGLDNGRLVELVVVACRVVRVVPVRDPAVTGVAAIVVGFTSGLSISVPLEGVENDRLLRRRHHTIAPVSVKPEVPTGSPVGVISVSARLKATVVQRNALVGVRASVDVIQLVLVGKSDPHVSRRRLEADLDDRRAADVLGRLVAPPAD